eukprot:CAMPEP_0196597558 /NCGR_PEP_ID=MMETSP1081-20130531/91993_1 /TAXON_ID=36882 /ORGANISM="Pyramimonas amylifera, Strain CCMP720" /LENGTH=35 /DNA_ID= /DNA_START= /DNA_END= /DNA_ORIENTATION=
MRKLVACKWDELKQQVHSLAVDQSGNHDDVDCGTG